MEGALGCRLGLPSCRRDWGLGGGAAGGGGGCLGLELGGCHGDREPGSGARKRRSRIGRSHWRGALRGRGWLLIDTWQPTASPSGGRGRGGCAALQGHLSWLQRAQVTVTGNASPRGREGPTVPGTCSALKPPPPRFSPGHPPWALDGKAWPRGSLGTQSDQGLREHQLPTPKLLEGSLPV